MARSSPQNVHNRQATFFIRTNAFVLLNEHLSIDAGGTRAAGER